MDTVSTEPVTWDVTSSITSSALAAGFRIDISDGFADLDASLDEIRIGTSFDAVVVPEPSTYFLLGLGLLSIVAFRRRRA